MVAVHGLAAIGDICLHDPDNHCACQFESGCANRVRGYVRGISYRIMGYSNQPVALFYCRASTIMDHTCLAYSKFVYRADNQNIGMGAEKNIRKGSD